MLKNKLVSNVSAGITVFSLSLSLLICVNVLEAKAADIKIYPSAKKVKTESGCNIYKITNADNKSYFKFCEVENGVNIYSVIPTDEEETNFIITFAEGETYFRKVDDKNGKHLEIHMSRSYLRNACIFASALIWGFDDSFGSNNIYSPQVTAILNMAGLNSCQDVTNGVWMNVRFSDGFKGNFTRVEWGWLQ